MKTPPLSLALLVAFAGAAHADPPGFVTLDRASASSAAAADFGFIIPHGSEVDSFAVRTDLHGRYVTRMGGGWAGGYGSFAITHLAIEDAGPIQVDDPTGVSNLEVGGIYVLDLDALHLPLRLGLSLPTASDELLDVAANLAGNVYRLADLSNSIPETMFLRLGASPMFQSGGAFVRADLGVDLPIYSDNDFDDVFGRLNLGAGYDFGPLAAMLELVNLSNLTADGDFADRTLHTAAVSVRSLMGEFRPYATVVLPLDESARDDVVSVGIGLEGVFNE